MVDNGGFMVIPEVGFVRASSRVDTEAVGTEAGRARDSALAGMAGGQNGKGIGMQVSYRCGRSLHLGLLRDNRRSEPTVGMRG